MCNKQCGRVILYVKRLIKTKRIDNQRGKQIMTTVKVRTDFVLSETTVDEIITQNRLKRSETASRFASAKHIIFYVSWFSREVDRTMKVVSATSRHITLESVHGKYIETFFYETLQELEDKKLLKCIH